MNAAVSLMDGLGLDGDRCIRVIPRQKRPPHNRYKLWVFLASSSSDPGNRDSGNNTADSWSSTWLLCLSDEKNLQFGNRDNQENN